MTDNSTNCTFEVCDSTYGGFNREDGVFYTRVNSNTYFTLDRMGERSLVFNVNADSLLE